MDRATKFGPWKALILEVPRRIDDEVVGALAPITLGAELKSAAPDTTTIRIVLRSPGRAAEA